MSMEFINLTYQRERQQAALPADPEWIGAFSKPTSKQSCSSPSCLCGLN
jgi:hypothetical protein